MQMYIHVWAMTTETHKYGIMFIIIINDNWNTQVCDCVYCVVEQKYKNL